MYEVSIPIIYMRLHDQCFVWIDLLMVYRDREREREKHGAWRQLRPNVPCLEIHDVHKEPLQEGRGAAA